MKPQEIPESNSGLPEEKKVEETQNKPQEAAEKQPQEDDPFLN